MGRGERRGGGGKGREGKGEEEEEGKGGDLLLRGEGGEGKDERPPVQSKNFLRIMPA